jgi:hypothetical protein
MHVWRFPLVNLAALLAFVMVAVAWETLAWMRRSAKSEITRGLFVSSGIVIAVLPPFIVNVVVEPELRDLAARAGPAPRVSQDLECSACGSARVSADPLGA